MTAPQRQAEATLLRLYLQTQTELQQRGSLPVPAPTRLDRFRRPLEVAGAVNLGLLVAGFTLFLLFVVLNLVFHVQFSFP